MNLIAAVKTTLLGLLILCIAGLAGIAVLSCGAAVYLDSPLDPRGEAVTFEVPRGAGFSAVAQGLEHAGIITRPSWLAAAARLRGKASRIRAGEYRLSPAMTPREVLAALVDGKTVLHRLTVPEGLTMAQIAVLVERAGFGRAEDFFALASNPAVAASLGVEEETLEGYLFPETYYFKKNETPEKVVDAMVRRFHAVFSPAWRDRARELGMSVHEAVTLASIIEKETSAPQERRLVSSVYHNRLKKGVRLQSDPTVIYGIPDFDGNITRKHLETPTSYNTYVIKGLPPGPIANPGAAALEAALNPEDTNFLYFVAKQNGEHQFSTNLRDHNQAVRKHQLRR